MNRIPPITDNGNDWLPGLPAPGTICDVRPIVQRSDVWRNLLIVGCVANDPEGRMLVRVPTIRGHQSSHGLTFGMTFRPLRTEWRPIYVPSFLESSLA